MKGSMNNPRGSLLSDAPVVTAASSALNSLSDGKWTLSCEMALNASPVMVIIIIIIKIIISYDDNVRPTSFRSLFTHFQLCLIEKCASRVAC